VDNEKLFYLYGVLDENIKQFHAALDVSVARRGENFSILRRRTAGPPRGLSVATLLRTLQSHLTIDDVQLGLRDQFEARMSATTVEPFHLGVRVTSHIRSRRRRLHQLIGSRARRGSRRRARCPEPMPASHREYAKWTPERMRDWAATSARKLPA
jgi:phosphate starvation-inducible protein PhoH